MAQMKSVLDKFHEELMDDDQFNEAAMRVALRVAQYYAGPGAKLTEEDYELAMDLCTRLSVS